MLALLAAPVLFFAATLDYILLFAPKRALGAIPDWWTATYAIDYVVTILTSLVILALNYFKLREVNERRRIRLVVLGLMLFAGVQLAGFVFIFFKTLWLSTLALSALVFGLAQVPFTICVAYAVLRQRLFQVSFIVRQSLQYAVARGALLIPVPILAGILIFDLVAHQDQPLGLLLSAHGWAYVLMGVAGVVAMYMLQ